MKSLFFILLILTFQTVTPQSVGFGCLGLVGGFGGYGVQQYEAKGLNGYFEHFNVKMKDSLINPVDDFKQAMGFRVGINVFRADISGFILTVKGFYQFLNEKKDAEMNLANGQAFISSELQLNHFGAGIDIGLSLSQALNWKVIDASVLFNSAQLTNTRNYPGIATQINKYESEETSIGYTIGTGVIFYLIGKYVSLEALAGYTVFTINRMRLEGTETYLTVNEDSNVILERLIDNGGFNAVIQLNIGIPL